MFKVTRWLAVVAVAVAVAALGASALAAKPKKGKPDHGTIWAAITHTSGTTDYLAGNVTDKVLGTGAITFAAKATAGKPGTVTLTVNPVISFFKTGSLTGTSKATLVIGSGGAVTITGTITETKGTEALKGHSLVGTFTGSAASVTGPFKFTYLKVTYK